MGTEAPPEIPEMPADQKDDDQIPTVTLAKDAPTVFVDGAWFAVNSSGVVRISFIENTTDPINSPAPGVKARHVVTLAMPRVGFNAMVSYLTAMQDIFATNDLLED